MSATIGSGLSDNSEQCPSPELIFGLVGPIGVDISMVVKFLSKSLGVVGYKCVEIHLTDHMEIDRVKDVLIDRSTYSKKYNTLIKYANRFRKEAGEDSAMAGLAIRQIRLEREKKTGSKADPAMETAYIIRQFKRAEEIELLRQTYGRKFIQVSVFGSEIERTSAIVDKIKRYDSTPKTEIECQTQAMHLIDIDFNQVDDVNGQRLTDVFHLADVFVDGINSIKSEKTVDRFVQALFGSNKSSPNRDEYGLYTAAAAALRSVDLSRQVGAAIFSKPGEVITLGCNEVPKAGGGTYWIDEEPEIHRDIEFGADPNQERRNTMLHDFLERMQRNGYLNTALTERGDVSAQVQTILLNDAIKDSQIMDIIEFGRIIHAEMSAISDAARLGRSTKDATLFCTAFPCHMCAKHIVASGIERVVFLEPYPKSWAKQLHNDSITFDKSVTSKVLFEPFLGISPRRYRDLFEKKKRKDKLGKAKDWYYDVPTVMMEDRGASYIAYEGGAVIKSIGRLALDVEVPDQASTTPAHPS